MKKLLSLLLAFLLIFSFTACNSNSQSQDDLKEIEDVLNSVVDGQQEILDDLVDLETLPSEGTPEPSTTLTAETLPTESEAQTTEATTESQATPTETAPSESVPDETEENELPMDIFEPEETTSAETTAAIDEDGTYTTMEDVALYIHTYGKLPQNFITKSEARALGWEGGSLEPYAPGKCIGGDRFGNYEGLLPTNRKYTECDIDTLGAKSRGAKRIVFSNDGLIYYTDDHYESFTLLYGEE